MRFAKLWFSFLYFAAITVRVTFSISANAAEIFVADPLPGTGSYNLVTNGNFNAGIGGWSRIATEPYGTMAWSNTEGFNGIGSITSTPTVPRSGPGFAYQQQVTGLIPNQTYILSGAFKVDDINTGNLYIDMTDAVGGDTGYRPELGLKPQGWFFTYNSFTPNGTTANVRIIRDTYGNDLQAGGYVDEIAVTPFASFVAPTSAVPEPSSLLLLTPFLCSLLTRRRRA
jgi:hypothetical protein